MDKIFKLALALAIAHAARGNLGFATAKLASATGKAIQSQQLSYGKFNRMLIGLKR